MKILVIRLSSLGDIVLTQPICAELREHYPSATIDYMTYPAFVTLVKTFGTCNNIITYKKNLAFHLQLLHTHYDLILDLHNKLSTRIVSRLVKSRRKSRYQKSHWLRRQIVKHRTDKSISSTVSLYYSVFRSIPELQKLTDAIPRKPILLPNREIPTVMKGLVKQGRVLVALFPGAAHPTKMYPVSSWAKVIAMSAPQYQYVLLGSKNEYPLCETLHQSSPVNTTNLCGLFSIAELITVLNTVDIVLSNDSGPMHLAAALQKKQIAIFGSVHPKLGFAPMNDSAQVLCADLECQPCSLHGSQSCPLGHFKCMRELKPELVLKYIDLLWDGIA